MSEATGEDKEVKKIESKISMLAKVEFDKSISVKKNDGDRQKSLFRSKTLGG